MKICIVSYMYPSEYSSSDFVFVKNLVDEFARQGHECVVVSPFWTLKYKHWNKLMTSYFVDDKYKVAMIRPNFFSVSNLRIGSTYMSPVLHKIAVNRALNKMKFKPDVIYCHFWKQGLEAYPYAKRYHIPLFVATGECEIFVNNHDGKLNDFTDYVQGVICVSTKNKHESIDLKLTIEEKCCVIPNSIDNNTFKVTEKLKARKSLGLPLDRFIIIFVGSFANRKGTMRVSKALKQITEKNVYSIFIGAGGDNPDCPNILYKGKVNHDELPKYLNAADAFVLPTLQEGCCNAIVEAMACGLPIISSDLSFNWDILDSSNSIMVDPMNVDEIRNAIEKLRDNAQLRESMKNASLQRAQLLTIGKRAERIIDFIDMRLDK